METSPPLLSHDRTPRLSLLRALAAMLTIGLLLLLAWPDFPSFGEDSLEYRNLMLNHWDLVHQPFSSRFLHAEVVSLLVRVTGISVQSAACGVAVGALLLLVAGMTRVFAKSGIAPMLLIPVMVGCSLMETVRLVYMPDLFYTLLLVGFFLLLIGGQLLPAAGMVFVLFCARESTLVLGVVLCALLLGVRRQSQTKWNTIAAFAAATLLGFLFNRYVSSKSSSNVHHISGMTYMVGKVPFNFMKNVLGIEPWTNTLTATAGNNPIYQHALPHWIHLGEIHIVGITDISARYPLRWIADTLCTFGVLLTIIFRQLVVRISQVHTPSAGRWNRLQKLVSGLKNFILEEPFYSRVALVYGLISLAIVPILGTAVSRYIYYAWPAFWITGVRYLHQQYLSSTHGLPRASRIQLLIFHLLLAWTPVVVGLNDASWLRLVLLLIGIIMLHAITWKALSKVQIPLIANG